MEYPILYDYIDPKWQQRPGGYRIPRYGVAHDTGNPGATARQNVNYFNTRNLSSSAHAFIDDKEIIIMIPLTEKAFHVRQNVSDANDWAIGVELCFGGNINFQEAYKRYVWFWGYLCKRYNFNPRTQIKGHYTLDPTRRTDPINAFSKNNVTYAKFLNDVERQVKQVTIPDRPTIVLREGENGDGIAETQRQLAYLGYYKGAIDGSFGPKTKQAVLSFQRAQKLVVDGLVGPKTAGALRNEFEKRRNEEILNRGDTGVLVERLQRQLTSLGYKIGEVDGSYGPATEKAVREFQRARNIKVDGIVGLVTKNELVEALRENVREGNVKPAPRPGPTPSYRYRVQLGVFENEQAARDLVRRAQAEGFSATVVAVPVTDAT